MKKTKTLSVLGIIMIVLPVAIIIYRLIESIIYDINGWRLIIPGPSLDKWYDIFSFNIRIDIVFVGPIFILGVVLLFLANKNKKAK